MLGHFGAATPDQKIEITAFVGLQNPVNVKLLVTGLGCACGFGLQFGLTLGDFRVADFQVQLAGMAV